MENPRAKYFKVEYGKQNSPLIFIASMFVELEYSLLAC